MRMSVRGDEWLDVAVAKARKTACGYFGCDGLCVHCPAAVLSRACNVSKALDVIRRAKALAGVSE